MTIRQEDVPELVRRYVTLGLRLGRHNPDIVDSYYGPAAWRAAVEAEAVAAPAELVADARELIAALEADSTLEAQRARWLRSQTVGLHTVARHLAGEELDYLEEVELSYGVRPERITEDEVMAAQRRLDSTLRGGLNDSTLSLPERLSAMRERHVIPVERLRGVIDNLAQELRERTHVAFGLPADEGVIFDLVSDKPWSGFNVYQGNFRSLVTMNTDLPVLSTSIAHLVAHEAYPGHHTEGCRKEQGLFHARNQVEQSIALIGTPSCLLAEGLADLGLEALMGPNTDEAVEPMLRAAGVHYELDTVTALSAFSETLARARGTLALMLHADGRSTEDVIATAQRWFVVDEARATQMVRFLTDPTWRAYVFCYAEGHRLCRGFMAGDPRRFARLLDEQLTPPELSPTPPAR
ncbi:MAG: DUF885 domain-containing protein [Actinobacteria bacterium]|nr:DUF885 domain-containing protein [Actinomycetota bacterium]